MRDESRALEPGRISSDDLEIFTRELSAALRHRLPIPEAVGRLSREIRSRRFRRALAEVEADLGRGIPLSDALARHGGLFPPFFVHALRAGEAGGDLLNVLDRMTAHQRAMTRLRLRIRAQLFYPLIVLLSTGAVIAMILIWVIPALMELYGGTMAEAMLPWPTRVLIAASQLLTESWHLFASGLVLAIVLFRILLRNEVVRADWGMILVSIPLLGRVVRYLDLARFSRSVGSLLSCRVPLPDALLLTVPQLRNGAARVGCYRMSREVSRGIRLSETMTRQRFYPEFFRWVVDEGEIREELDTTLDDLGIHYQQWAEERILGYALLAEPVVLLAIGLIVFFLGYGLYGAYISAGDLMGPMSVLR